MPHARFATSDPIGFKQAHLRPAGTEAAANHRIDLLRGGDAVAHQNCLVNTGVLGALVQQDIGQQRDAFYIAAVPAGIFATDNLNRLRQRITGLGDGARHHEYRGLHLLWKAVIAIRCHSAGYL